MLSSIPLTWNEALSGIAGNVSLASWVFLLLPQLLENYRQRSAQGVSLTFICIWLFGDIASLAGALWAKLVPTVVVIAIWFCISDVLLISQCLYYNALNRRIAEGNTARRDEEGLLPPGQEERREAEETPLLGANGGKASKTTAVPTRQRGVLDVTGENLGLPGSRRRSSVASRRLSSGTTRGESFARILEEPTGGYAWLKNLGSVLMVIGVGAAAWAISWKTGAWKPVPLEGNKGGSAGTPVGAEILGYISALLYLGARIPQIVKNQREKSCDGLSLLFFMFSLLGNSSYGAGILFHSIEKEYVLKNLPWLIGSLGTIAEDSIIFIQFSVFGEKKNAGADADAVAVD